VSIALVFSDQTQGDTGQSVVVNATGANLLILNMGYYPGADAGPPGVPTDSESNTWVLLTRQSSAFDKAQCIAYCLNPTVSATLEIFVNQKCAAQVYGFSGVDDIQASVGALSASPGPLTADTDGALYFSGATNTFDEPSIDSSFTGKLWDINQAGAPFANGGAAAYLIQGTAAEVDPTWTITGGGFSTMVVFLAAGAGPSGFTLLSNTEVVGEDGGTSGAIDTTGAKLLVVHVSSYSGAGSVAVSDSKGNTWVPRTPQDEGETMSQIFDCVSPTTDAAHTFTITGTGSFAAAQVEAWGNDSDVEFGGESGADGLTPGSVTPDADGALVVTGVSGSASASTYAASGFTVSDSADYNVSTNEGGAMAYLVQTSAAAANPTWTANSPTHACSTIAWYKATAAPPPAADHNNLLLLGCG
jgi:hypothetical protein